MGDITDKLVQDCEDVIFFFTKVCNEFSDDRPFVAKLPAETDPNKRTGELFAIINQFISLEQVRINTHSFEYGDIGYECPSKLVYWLVPPHYNLTSNKSYAESQCAVAMQLDRGILKRPPYFAYRSNRDSLFKTHPMDFPYNHNLPPNPGLTDMLNILRTGRALIIAEKRFLQDGYYENDQGQITFGENDNADY